jgi:hypothetical protein
MNVWKPIAIVATAGLVAMVGVQVASANKGPDSTSSIAAGPCAGQPNMAAAVGSLEAAYNSLKAALPDKGGNRVKAMGMIKDGPGNVISVVQAGCVAGGGN